MSRRGSVDSQATVASGSTRASQPNGHHAEPSKGAPQMSPSNSSTATPTTARHTEYSVMSATTYVKAKSDDQAIELCNSLRQEFIRGRADHDRDRTGKRTLQALQNFETALTADSGSHPFASLAPTELCGCIAALLTFVDEDADGFAGTVRERAEHALELLVEKATSPREIHHQMLVRMTRAGKRYVDLTLPPGLDPDDEEYLDKTCALHELSVLIRLQASALPRIRTKRMVAFVRPLANATRNALTRVMNEDHPPGHRIPRVTEATVLRSIAELVHTIIGLDPHDSDVLELLRDYLLHTLAQLASSPPLAAVLAENYFRKQHPRFTERLFEADPGTRQADAEAWTIVKLAAHELKLGSQGLFHLASRHDMPAPGPPRFRGSAIQDSAPTYSSALALPDPRAKSHPPLASQGAFVLLAHLLADEAEQEGLIGGWYALRCTLPHILGALTNAGGQAIDETLFWLFWSFDHGLEASQGRTEEIDEATLYPIVECLSSHAATAADEDARFLCFRLLTILIVKVLRERDDLQLTLIIDLLDNAPYAFLRAAALGLLRDLVIDRLQDQRKSLFRTPSLVTELGKHVLRATPSDLATTSLESFIDEADLQANAERLSLIYAVLTADEANRTTLRSIDRIRNIKDGLLGPLRQALKRWKEDDDTDPLRLNALDVLSMQLDLAQEAVNRFDK